MEKNEERLLNNSLNGKQPCGSCVSVFFHTAVNRFGGSFDLKKINRTAIVKTHKLRVLFSFPVQIKNMLSV